MYLFLLSVMISQSQAHWSIPQDQPIDLGACLDNIIDNFSPTTRIYTIDFDQPLKKPTIRLHSDQDGLFWFKIEKSEVVIVNHSDDLEQLLKKLRKNQLINFRSHFIILTDNITTSLFTTTAHFFINKLLVVEKSSLAVYTYTPFIHGSANQPSVDFFHVASCTGLVKLPQHHLPRKWPNTTITALNNIVPPYCICPSCSKDKGIEIEAFNIIAQHLHFQVEYTRESFDYWGSKHNGSYTHILGDLEEQRGEMTIGVFHSKFDEHLDFDMSFTYMEDGTRWLVPKARILPYWKRFSLIFTKEVYLAILFSILCVVLVCHFLYSRTLSSSCMMLYQILLECSVERMPDFRTVTIFWVGSCLILSTMFKSKLVDTMSKNSYEHQINSLNDIVTSGLHILIDHDIARFYDFHTDSDEEYVTQHYEYCTDPRICINRTAFRRDCATIDFIRSNLFFLHQLVDAEGEVLVHLFKESVFPVHIQLFFIKGYPIFPQINHLLVLLRSNGIVQHLYDEAGHNAKLAMSRKTTFKVEVLGLKQMQIAFLMWGLGVLLSLGIFILEFLAGIPVRKSI